MKLKTKRQLNLIFSLGLVTALLSIGRAATLTRKALSEDTTCKPNIHSIPSPLAHSSVGNMVPSYYFTMFEDKLGIIFACAPAIRQFWAYRSRTHTFLPSKQQQYPNEDFEKMRYRINLRDIFWYRQARTIGDRVFEASPIFRSRKSPRPEASSDDPQSSKDVTSSVLDTWENKIKNIFPKLFSARKWGAFSPGPESSTVPASRETFLLSNSRADTSAAMTRRDDRDDEVSDEQLFNTRMKATSRSEMV